MQPQEKNAKEHMEPPGEAGKDASFPGSHGLSDNVGAAFQPLELWGNEGRRELPSTWSLVGAADSCGE